MRPPCNWRNIGYAGFRVILNGTIYCCDLGPFNGHYCIKKDEILLINFSLLGKFSIRISDEFPGQGET
jgi:hypothetical protein